MMSHFLIDGVFAFSFGRNFHRDANERQLWLAIIPRTDLTDEGEMILAGLSLDITFRAPFSRGRGDWQSHIGRADYRWKSPITVRLSSDANRIATRLAACPA